jgi:thiol-disulfide isomerase/thioredoxin
MKKIQLFLVVFILSAFVLAACGSNSGADNIMLNDPDAMDNQGNTMNENMTDDMTNDNNEMAEDSHADMDDSIEDNDDDMMESEEMDDMSDDMGESASTPAWFDYQFTDVSTGETFTLNGFRGQVVLVEMMATWCSNCMKQQRQVKELHNLLADRDDFVGVGISVELELEPSRLARYVQDNGFDWTYGLADQEVQQGIIDSFGGQYLNPPATPMVIVDKDGGTHPLPLGKIQTADELMAFLEPYLN